jgi:hypothetical protein
MIAYDDDVAVAPRDLISAAEEGADGLEELADLGLHSLFGYRNSRLEASQS